MCGDVKINDFVYILLAETTTYLSRSLVYRPPMSELLPVFLLSHFNYSIIQFFVTNSRIDLIVLE